MEVVIAFGRFNPPTTGHAKLISFVQREAARRRADVVIFPSQTTQERKANPKNPLPFEEKVRFLKLLFPRVAFNENTRIHTIFDALAALSNMGYDKVHVVAGSDRVAEFEALKRYIKPKGRRGGTDIILPDGMDIIPVPGNRDPDAEDVSGMSASKMRAAAVAGDWELFRSGVPTTNEHLAKRIYTSVRRYMGIKESTLLRFADFVILHEADTSRPPGAPKQPTEVDRLKDTQKQQLILTKARQANELLQAKQRELAKKSRDDMNKIKTGDKPRTITR
jgi:Cytidylyltransferase-like